MKGDINYLTWRWLVPKQQQNHYGTEMPELTGRFLHVVKAFLDVWNESLGSAYDAAILAKALAKAFHFGVRESSTEPFPDCVQ